ncbi:hypothetical protein C3747_13g2129c [Trypanosoma cruzi]|uniref:Uncharacterized protein n=3 Tax=Trypanosoma cruzi TaxID=5693 RepID=Q4CSJ1_TRYCC|nr:hypothetical protein, conserved [Trypanosoma cruzi]XP_822124.1 hypothetical protein, conserved [Trypanosoma cruzi]ESS70969.1 hypothetical protein TCDM_14458 [Trypanosoma cruzi Dm28c]PBJ72689.1 hypothetical protein BCY84_15254 [Trypanosoma cruzi cruzi]EAN83242.1 hypothetical protein, conserved [Trypanosoma cruzi]EAO00273.1 hypothetical protein, conserved [Trypanosoma cruzi]KAF8276504.1 hypothetical protein TcBrA4_0130160 [Trypanosoma cruzi]|eukprot:XP_805093.1 hypothetical protein [Trypanosoma cruzi strain CL Brener]
MKKSISLKEFSTTPTVSYMLSKDGHNIAGALDCNNGNNNAPRPAVSQAVKEEKMRPASNDSRSDVMFDME